MFETRIPWQVEIAPNNRRLCLTKQCPRPGRKIHKGDLILGESIGWRMAEEDAHKPFYLRRPIRPGYRYRHWGCVSAYTIQEAKTAMREPVFGGTDWSKLGGVLGEALDQAIKRKVIRVIEQGHVDPEDFNGDPAYNTTDSITTSDPGILRWVSVRDNRDGDKKEAGGNLKRKRDTELEGLDSEEPLRKKIKK